MIANCINKDCKAHDINYLFNCEINGFTIFDENKITGIKCNQYIPDLKSEVK